LNNAHQFYLIATASIWFAWLVIFNNDGCGALVARKRLARKCGIGETEL